MGRTHVCIWVVAREDSGVARLGFRLGPAGLEARSCGHATPAATRRAEKYIGSMTIGQIWTVCSLDRLPGRGEHTATSKHSRLPAAWSVQRVSRIEREMLLM